MYKNNRKICFGVIIGTRAYFNSELARDVRKQLLKTIEEQGYDYVILPEDATPTGSSSIETREDALKCAKLFREHRDEIDGIIVSLPNFGFEIGIINAIKEADLNVPVLVQACDDSNDKVDLDSRRDAFCGKISVCNNLYQYGIPFTDTTLHTYSIYSPMLVEDLNKFAGICRVVNGLRHCRIGQIGTRPLGFNTCRASEKLLQRTGITVVPADLSELIFAAEAISEDDPQYLAKKESISAYAKVPANYEEKLPLVIKFALAVERWRPPATLPPLWTGTTTSPRTARCASAPTAETSLANSSATTTSSSLLSECSEGLSERSRLSEPYAQRYLKATSPTSVSPPTTPKAGSRLTSEKVPSPAILTEWTAASLSPEFLSSRPL